MTKRKALDLLEKRYQEEDMTQEEKDALGSKEFFFFVVGLYAYEVGKSEEKKIGKSADAYQLVTRSINCKQTMSVLMKYIKNQFCQITKTEDVRPGTYIAKLVSYIMLYVKEIFGEEYWITEDDKAMILTGMTTD